ncbi:hypothetical protein FA95DRAFT_1566499 [Auriscalpium vulgare]|uniref:Uncharacterized protein n=1 Tax=Auriscalpium vulgare TaxID=40419 RepID=A0ACB8R9L7_9AGAM|nr:hypothetical protein FA95DRAFT_1566499 [Auriscalpium vulgare]
MSNVVGNATERVPFYHGAPFDDNDADIILRSSDLADFRTYKVLLAKASPFFKTILSLPQPPTEPVPLRDGLLVISVPESRAVLEGLLTAISPVAPNYPLATSFDALLLLLAAQKYEMTSALANIRAHAPGDLITPANAFRVYNFAWQHRLVEETERAARITLERPMTMETYGPELQFAVGPALHKLWEYRSLAQQAVGAWLLELSQGKIEGLPSDSQDDENALHWWETVLTERCTGEPQFIVEDLDLEEEETDACIRKWWTDFFEEAAKCGRGVVPHVALNRAAFLEVLMEHVADEDCDICQSVFTVEADMDMTWNKLERNLRERFEESIASFNFF